MMKLRRETVQLKDREITVYLADNDVNGNSRAIVHFLELGLKDYISIAKHTPMKKYIGKAFGGGYIFQCNPLEQRLEQTLELLEKYYSDFLGEFTVEWGN